MTLEEHIDGIRSDLSRKGVFANEASVSQGIVLRLLHALGWPRYNTQVIIPEYPVEGGRVDFALCHPLLEPLVFIEVKQVGQIGGAERQLFEYAFHKGVPIVILTDGREWHFFQPSGQGDYRERRVYRLNLIEKDSKESAARLNRYLNYESIRTDEAIRAIEEDYRNISRQRQIETRLPEAWSKLVEEADELLIEIVADKVESLHRYKPTVKQVLNFLKSLKREQPLEEIDSHISLSATPPAPSSSAKGPKGYDQVQDYLIPIIQLMRKGKSHNETFHSVAEKLDVTYQTVNSQCTRTLKLNTQEFVEHVQNGRIIQIMKDKYPQQIELINELEKSL